MIRNTACLYKLITPLTAIYGAGGTIWRHGNSGKDKATARTATTSKFNLWRLMRRCSFNRNRFDFLLELEHGVPLWTPHSSFWPKEHKRSLMKVVAHCVGVSYWNLFGACQQKKLLDSASKYQWGLGTGESGVQRTWSSVLRDFEPLCSCSWKAWILSWAWS